MKVGHWIPAYRGQIRAEIVGQALTDALALNRRGDEYHQWWSDSTDLPRARNQALDAAIDKGLDYLCMQDSDIFSYPGSPIADLIDTAREKKATVTAAICGLRGRDAPRANVRPYKQNAIYQAEAVGTGLVLIDVKQVSSFEYEGPWFARTYKDERQTEADVGEDIFLSLLVSKHSGTIWVNGCIPTTHVNMDNKLLDYVPTANTAGKDAASSVVKG